MRNLRLRGSYNQYVPVRGPRQWHRMAFDEWVWLKRNPDNRSNFLAKLAGRLAKSGMKLVWLTPRYVKGNDGKSWVYWKAVRP